jgi:hypothetical protein
LNWRNALGRLKEVSCRVALRKLECRGELHLPAVRPAVAVPRRVRAASPTPPEVVLPVTSLEALQPLRLVRIEGAGSSAARLWNELMNRYHYLGVGPLCGAQMRYLLGSARGEWLGGLAFSAAAWQVQARDQWIGWDAAAGRCWAMRGCGNAC